MNVEFISLTLETAGTLFIAYAALKVHYRFLNEHKIDELVFKTMHREQTVGFLGVCLVVAGYIVNVVFL